MFSKMGQNIYLIKMKKKSIFLINELTLLLFFVNGLNRFYQKLDLKQNEIVQIKFFVWKCYFLVEIN